MIVRKEQLDVQLERLEQAFGDKFFDDQRARMIWLAVEGLEYDSVIKIVDGFIRTSRQAPLPCDFEEAARGFGRKRQALGEYQENARCKECHDSGFARVTYRGVTGYGPCACDRGRQLIEADKRSKRPIGFRTQYGPHWHESEGEGA